jgi:hypothetical protein
MYNGNSFNGSVIWVIIFIILIVPLMSTGILVGQSVAIKAAEIQGFSDIKILEKAWFFIPLRGGDRGDSARFKVEATNPIGEKVTFYVFSGWLFKGATIRTW